MSISYSNNPESKKWSARAWWIDKKGKRCSAQKGRFETKKAAELWAIDKIDDGSRVIYPNAHKLTLGKFLDDWISIKEKKLSPT